MPDHSEIIDIEHDELVDRAQRYLENTLGCGFSFGELHTGAPEIPDAIGWKGPKRTILIECKTTRSDFFADQEKLARQGDFGMGDFRFYMCPRGLVDAEECPEGWGLIEVRWHAGRLAARRVRGPTGRPGSWSEFSHEKWYHGGDRNRENQLLYSALRRLRIRGHLETIYDAYSEVDHA